MTGDVTIITPEHVEIRLTPAGLGRRFIAWLADFVVIIGLITIVRIACNLLGVGLGTLLSTTISFILMWGYHVFCDVMAQGRSPGKRMLGLRVVDDRGLPVNLQQSFVRNVVRILDQQPGIFYGVGGLVCLMNKQTRRMGDLAAGTMVVHETKPLQAPKQLSQGRQFNSLLSPRVTRLIRNRVTLEEREFLLSLCMRAPGMDDRARFDLMDEVGRHYREKLQIDDEHLSGENLVRGLTAVLFEKKPAYSST